MVPTKARDWFPSWSGVRVQALEHSNLLLWGLLLEATTPARLRKFNFLRRKTATKVYRKVHPSSLHLKKKDYMIKTSFFLKKKKNQCSEYAFFFLKITIKIFKEILHRQIVWHIYDFLFWTVCHTVSHGRPMLRENTRPASLLPASGCFSSKHLSLQNPLPAGHRLTSKAECNALDVNVGFTCQNQPTTCSSLKDTYHGFTVTTT